MSNEQLKIRFQNLLENFTNDQNIISEYWKEIEKSYENKKRFYHTLNHLTEIFIHFDLHKNLIESPSAFQFSIFYHDIIYDVTKGNNEEKSAVLAVRRMSQLGIEPIFTEKTYEQIRATKNHETNDQDTQLLLDCDLAILGSEKSIYETYTKNIREEFSIYPKFLYNNGRKKVIEHFLKKDKIFKTEAFFAKEINARENLTWELDQLSK